MGGIGQTIYSEDENVNVQRLGSIGSPVSLNNAPGVEVRGTTGYNTNTGFDIDYYQGTADWFRPAFANIPDQTPVQAAVGISARVGADQIAGFVFLVWDGQGRLIDSGFDFVVGDQAAALFGAENVQLLESSDRDFIGAIYNPASSKDAIAWEFPTIVGPTANTFTVGLTGFAVDMSGNFQTIGYTLDWAFA